MLLVHYSPSSGDLSTFILAKAFPCCLTCCYIYQKMRSSCINRYIYRTLSFTVQVLLTYMNFFLSNQNMQMANAYLYCKVKYVRRTSPSRRLHGKQLNYPSYLSKTLKYDMVLPINFYLVRKKIWIHLFTKSKIQVFKYTRIIFVTKKEDI